MVKKIALSVVICMATLVIAGQIKPVSNYHEGWIDFNKNGVKDVFEDPAQPVERRIADLLGSMTLEEKTCQTATLYDFGRVLKDELPTPGWKNEVWKDGIANIDEHLNGVAGEGAAPTPLALSFRPPWDGFKNTQHRVFGTDPLGATRSIIHPNNH